jgi:putative flippase GtrA
MSRFIRFNVVGALGLVLQLGVLAVLQRAGWALVAATLVAVEMAVLHNFLWHDRWTWCDRRRGSPVERLARFHATNGLTSLVGNAMLTWCFSAMGLPVVVANLAAVASCAVVNFASGDRFVFRLEEDVSTREAPPSLKSPTAR